jgi:hypothetical protein
MKQGGPNRRRERIAKDRLRTPLGDALRRRRKTAPARPATKVQENDGWDVLDDLFVHQGGGIVLSELTSGVSVELILADW